MAKTQTRSLAGFEVFSSYIAECGLEADMRETCLKHRVTLREVYLDTRGASVHAARLEIWWGLCHLGKSISEVGRMFSRDATSVSHAMRRLREVAIELNQVLSVDTVNEIARAVAANRTEKWKAAGQAVAAIINAKKEP